MLRTIIKKVVDAVKIPNPDQVTRNVSQRWLNLVFEDKLAVFQAKETVFVDTWSPQGEAQGFRNSTFGLYAVDLVRRGSVLSQSRS